MSAPLQDDRIEIWRYIYARSSLIEAREAAKLLLVRRDLSDEVKRAIICQIVVAYARPFTKSQVTDSKRIQPLAEDIVPVEFQDLHKEHLQMRDRAFGHKDAVAFPSTTLNRVVVQVDDRGVEFHTISPFTMLDAGLQRTITLCDRLMEHCESKVKPYSQHFAAVTKGIYVLSLEHNPARWLLKDN